MKVELHENEVVISVGEYRQLLESMCRLENLSEEDQEESMEVVEEQIQVTVKETQRRVQFLQETA